MPDQGRAGGVRIRLTDEAAWLVVKALREYAVNGLDIADTNPEDEAHLRREATIADDVIARLGGDDSG